MNSNPHGGTAAAGATRQLAEFASALKFEDLPAAVVEKAKTCVLDTLGCCIFGATLQPVRKLATMLMEENCAQQSAAFGFAQRTSASHAALINGASAHAFQLDEIHIEATLHPGSVAVPAVLALAEANGGVSGRDIITALAAGYECGVRVGLAGKGGMFARGFHNQGTSGVFVAAAAAARLLHLDAVQTKHALGIAGSQGAGLMAVQEGAMTKAFHSGRAAQSGVYAAKLARLGYTGIPDVLEAGYGGFLSSLVGEYQTGPLISELGKRWEILRVGFKPAPASNGSITAMAALDDIMRKHNLTADDIESVTAHVSTNTLHHCGWEYDPAKIQGVLASQMNLRYGMAVMALERRATVEQFTEDKMRDPVILEFVRRVQVELEPAFDADGGKFRVACRAVVVCRNGEKLEAQVLYRKGSHEDPMSAAEIDAKFMELAGRSFAPETARRIAETVAELERIEDSSELTQLLLRQA
ncbi:MAG: MmgE/PrpD family protein [Betaproteobacteria bacterium]|nr:MmgE/PrpD family protein [Betaproteobacteria bacterium]